MYVIQHGTSQESDMDVLKKVSTGTRDESQKFFGSSHERLQEVLGDGKAPVRLEERAFKRKQVVKNSISCELRKCGFMSLEAPERGNEGCNQENVWVVSSDGSSGAGIVSE